MDLDHLKPRQIWITLLCNEPNTQICSETLICEYLIAAQNVIVHVIVPKIYSFGTVELDTTYLPTRTYTVAPMLQLFNNCLGGWQA